MLQRIGTESCLDNEHNKYSVMYTALHFAAHFDRPAIVKGLLKELNSGNNNTVNNITILS